MTIAANASAGVTAGAPVVTPAASAVDREGAGLDRLMALLSKRRRGEVRFVEEDRLGILERPLKSWGVLVYEAPGHLEKRTLGPKPGTLIVDGKTVTVRRGRSTLQMDLSAYPQIAPYVDAVRDTLAGNLQGLEHVFKVRFEGSLGHWRLALTPLDRRAARRVRRIGIEGTRAEIRKVEIVQADGDRSVMQLAP